MGARKFNKHIPQLCCGCGAPMSVAKKRNGWEFDLDFLTCDACAWRTQEIYRKEFQEVAVVAESYWISTPSDDVNWDEYDWDEYQW